MAESLCHLNTTQIVFPFVKVDVVNGQRQIVSPVAARTVSISNLTNAPVTLTIQAAAMWLSCSFEGAGRTVQLAPFGSADLEIALDESQLGGLKEGSTVGQVSILGSPTNESWTIYVTLRLHLPAADGSISIPGNPPRAYPPTPISPWSPQPPQPPTVFPPAPSGAPSAGGPPGTHAYDPAAAQAPFLQPIKFDDKTPVVSPWSSGPSLPLPPSNPAGSMPVPLPVSHAKPARQPQPASRPSGIRHPLVSPLFGLFPLLIGRGANAASQQRYSRWHGQLSLPQQTLLLYGGMLANAACCLALSMGLYHLVLVASHPPVPPTILLSAVKGSGPRPEFDCRLKGLPSGTLLYMEAKVEGSLPQRFSLIDPLTGSRACTSAKPLHMTLDGALSESGDYTFLIHTRDASGRDCNSNPLVASIRVAPKMPDGFRAHIDPDRANDGLQSTDRVQSSEGVQNTDGVHSNEEHKLYFEWERPANSKISRAVLTRIVFDPKTGKSLDATELSVLENPTHLPLEGHPPKTVWVAPDMIKVAPSDAILFVRYGLRFETKDLVGETKLSHFFRIQYNHDVMPIDDPVKALQDDAEWSRKTLLKKTVPKKSPMEKLLEEEQMRKSKRQSTDPIGDPGEPVNKSKALPKDYNPFTSDPPKKSTDPDPGAKL